ncbi:VOC family protein [Pseudalkalibacillus sp. A8]|uniref:VOC family protein n=1 Tax=Pseudalkalibacillus sp. A8 TaxID=3382641 RepID=UPI0038B699A4
MNFEVIPFLSLNGKGATAIEFYEQNLGAKVLFKKTYKEMKEMDQQFSYEEGQDDYITHSVLQVGQDKIMIAEEAMDPTRPWQLGNSSSLCIQSTDFSMIKSIYQKLIQHHDVEILTPFAQNSFSTGYGIVRDPFGIVIQLTVTRHDF